jgi:hypothetical protein
VVLTDQTVKDMLRAITAKLASDEKVFPLSAENFRKTWWRVLRELDLEFCGPPHNLRHAGAAVFVEQGGELEECRRRGRWLQLSSVQRYTKTHWLVRHRAKVNDKVASLGARFWASPRKVLKQVMSSTPLGQKLLAAI